MNNIAKQILNNGDMSFASKFEGSNKEWVPFCRTLCEEVHQLDECSPQQAQNLANFMNGVAKLYRIDMWTRLVEVGMKRIDLIKSFHRELAPIVLGALPALDKLDPENKGLDEALAEFHKNLS